MSQPPQQHQTPCLTPEELRAASVSALSKSRTAHLDVCPLCRNAVDGAWLFAQVDGEASSPQVSPSTSSKKANRRPFYATRTFTITKWASVAAGFLCIVYAGLRYSSNSHYDPKLADTYAYVEEPYARVFRSTDDQRDLFFGAARSFEQGLLDSSIALYDIAIAKAQTELLQTRGTYERGIVHWKAGAFEPAISDLTAARHGAYEFYEDATWSLARLYEQTGEVRLAAELYRDLCFVGGGPYVSRATSALERLGEPIQSK